MSELDALQAELADYERLPFAHQDDRILKRLRALIANLEERP